MDLLKNVRIESYSEKYLSGHLGDGADQWVDWSIPTDRKRRSKPKELR